jgi:hypothetical protein
LAVVAGNGGADFGFNVLRKTADNGISAARARRRVSGGETAAGRSLIARSNGHPNCFRLPNNDFAATACSRCVPSGRDDTSKSQSSD